MSELQSHHEHLIQQCLEKIHLAFRTKDIELWKQTQHPQALEWLSKFHEGIYLNFLVAFQVHDPNFPSTSWKTLREFTSQDLDRNKFHDATPTHVLEYEIVPYSEVHKPLNQQVKVPKYEFALVQAQQAWLVPRLPSDEDLKFAEEFLEKRRVSAMKAESTLQDMESEIRDQILVFQVQRNKVEAMKLLMARYKLGLSESKTVVEKVWASRPLAE